MIGLTVGDGQGSASPKWAPAVERGSPTELDRYRAASEVQCGVRVRGI